MKHAPVYDLNLLMYHNCYVPDDCNVKKKKDIEKRKSKG